MPELPEVESYRAYVCKTSLHKKIVDVTAVTSTVFRKTNLRDIKKNVKGRSFEDVSRRGKYLILTLQGSSKKIVMHFGLTGSLAYTKNVREKVPYSKVIFFFAGHSALHWIDVRKFGAVYLVDQLEEIPALKDMGPEPLTLSKKQFLLVAAKRGSKNIKSFLMDQKVIAGIGNEYSDEMLFQAGIDPHHRVKDLSTVQLAKLYAKMISVLSYAVILRKRHMKELTGTGYVSQAESAQFKPSYLQAHRHTDGRCPKNKNHALKRATIGGRSSYYCPIDQK